MVSIVARPYPAELAESLQQAGRHRVLARILAARGIASSTQLEYSLAGLIPPPQMKDIDRMASIVADAIAQKKRLLIVADYDTDGATACAVSVRGLRMMGAEVDYLVPNRFEYGYRWSYSICNVKKIETILF